MTAPMRSHTRASANAGWRATGARPTTTAAPSAAARPRRAPNSAPTSSTAAGVRRLASHNERLEVELGGPSVDVQTLAAASDSGPLLYDCLGLAQAMVDVACVIEDELLEAELGLEKGSRRLISMEERSAVLERLAGRDTAIAAGGSLSNTLLALARLSEAGGAGLRVGMAGLVGADALGSYYTAQMEAAGVRVAAAPTPGAATGTVLVLTSPADAARTMLSYLGTPAEIAVDAALAAAISRSRLLVLEGYLWELPGAASTVAKAIAAAKAAGCIVAMTAGDASTVARHHAAMWAAIDAGIDLLFTNAAEAEALLQYEPAAAAARATGDAPSDPQQQQHCAHGEQLALRLAPHCSLAVVTDGAAGSYMAALGEIVCVPPAWMAQAPVDTCGAGDSYAAGLLYGYLSGLDLVSMGRCAARTASAVLSRVGAQLTPEAAAESIKALPPRRSGAAAAASMQRPASAPGMAPTTPRTA